MCSYSNPVNNDLFTGDYIMVLRQESLQEEQASDCCQKQPSNCSVYGKRLTDKTPVTGVSSFTNYKDNSTRLVGSRFSAVTQNYFFSQPKARSERSILLGLRVMVTMHALLQ